MGQWTNQGFVSHNISYYKDALQTVFTNAFGSDFNVTDETLPQNVIIQELAELFANADADGIEVLTQINPNTTSGVWLDMIGLIRGLPRNQGSSQKATVLVTSNGAYVPYSIPAGQTFTVVETGETFTTDSLVQIGSTSTSVVLTFASSGNSVAQIGNHLQTTGISAITTMEITGFLAGTEAETDLEYRTRLQASAAVANNTLQFISNELSLLQSVRSVGVEYNDTAEEVAGIPAYCTEFIVMPTPDVNQDSLPEWKMNVARTILWNKVPGAPTSGNTEVTGVVDPYGTEKTVNFTIPTTKNIIIDMPVATREEQSYIDLSTIGEIKEAIAEYINNLGTGVDVSMSRIFEIALKNAAFDITELKIKAEGDASWRINQNYPIDIRECAQTTVENIKIGG